MCGIVGLHLKGDRHSERLGELLAGMFVQVRERGPDSGGVGVYSDDGLAQIEDVGVLNRFRGRGLARRLIGHALQVIADEGRDTVFITAETNDWPHQFYRRLGFEHVEDRADFLLIKAS